MPYPCDGVERGRWRLLAANYHCEGELLSPRPEGQPTSTASTPSPRALGQTPLNRHDGSSTRPEAHSDKAPRPKSQMHPRRSDALAAVSAPEGVAFRGQREANDAVWCLRLRSPRERVLESTTGFNPAQRPSLRLRTRVTPNLDEPRIEQLDGRSHRAREQAVGDIAWTGKFVREVIVFRDEFEDRAFEIGACTHGSQPSIGIGAVLFPPPRVSRIRLPLDRIGVVGVPGHDSNRAVGVLRVPVPRAATLLRRLARPVRRHK